MVEKAQLNSRESQFIDICHCQFRDFMIFFLHKTHYSPKAEYTNQMFMQILWLHVVQKRISSRDEKVLESFTYYKPNCMQQVEINTWARHNLRSQKHTQKPQEAGIQCCPIIMWLFCNSHYKLLWLPLKIPLRVIGSRIFLVSDPISFSQFCWA